MSPSEAVRDLPLSDDGAVIPGLIRHLSASSVGSYLRCPRRYWYEYVLKEKPAADGGLISGRAVHHVIEVVLKMRLEGKGVDPHSVGDLTDEAMRVISNAEGFPVKDRDPFREKANRLTKAFHKQVLPSVRPVEVELDWERRIGDVKVVGRIDCLEQNAVRDWKTSGKTPEADAAFTSIQSEMYAYATDAQKSLHYTYLIDLKGGVKIVERVVDRPREIVSLSDFAEDTVKEVASGVRAGFFPRNRRGWHCSTRWCPFFQDCILNRNGRRP